MALFFFFPFFLFFDIIMLTYLYTYARMSMRVHAYAVKYSS